MGEPFTFGVNSVKDFMAENQFDCAEIIGSKIVMEAPRDPVYAIYKFCVARATNGASGICLDLGRTEIPATAGTNLSRPALREQRDSKPTH